MIETLIKTIKEEVDWTSSVPFEVEEIETGKIAIAGFWYEKDWGYICGVESTYDVVQETIDDLEEDLNLTIDDSVEADAIVREALKLGQDEDFGDESQGWICVIAQI